MGEDDFRAVRAQGLSLSDGVWSRSYTELASERNVASSTLTSCSARKGSLGASQRQLTAPPPENGQLQGHLQPRATRWARRAPNARRSAARTQHRAVAAHSAARRGHRHRPDDLGRHRPVSVDRLQDLQARHGLDGRRLRSRAVCSSARAAGLRSRPACPWRWPPSAGAANSSPETTGWDSFKSDALWARTRTDADSETSGNLVAPTGNGQPQGRPQPRNNALGASRPERVTDRDQNPAQSRSGRLNRPFSRPNR